MSEPSTDRAAARSYAEVLFGSTPRGALVEVRFRVSSGMGRCFQRVSRRDRLADSIVKLSEHTEVFVGVLPRRRRRGGRADVIARGRVVWADCDGSEAVAALHAFRPSPAIVVASSEQNRHAYWLLTAPVSVDLIEQTNRRIALALGADVRCSDRARILRPVGSVNRKRSEPVACGCLIWLQRRESRSPSWIRSCHASHHGRSLVSRVASRSSPPIRWRRSRRRCIERLTGLRVGPSGKLRCLFHDDRSPSLHVYQGTGGVAGIASVADAAARSSTSRRFFRDGRHGARTSSSCVASSRS